MTKLKVGMKAVNKITGTYMDVIKDQEVNIGDEIVLSNNKKYTFIKLINSTLILVTA